MLGEVGLQILIAVIIFAVGSGVGWAVYSWKNGAKIARLEANDAVVTAANNQCKMDIGIAHGNIRVVPRADIAYGSEP